MIILAIDQGTSGTKAIVVDAERGVLGLALVPVRPTYLPGGGVEQDPAELLSSVLNAGRGAIAEAGDAGRHIDAVTLANQGETVLAWDRRTGSPLSAAISWQDRRAEEICSELVDHAEILSARTGLVLDPYFSAPKMAWLRRHRTTGGVVTTTDSWLVHQLTGAFVTDVTTASRSLLLDIDATVWDSELLEIFGLAAEELPDLVPCDQVVGYTTAFGGPPGGICVAGLIVDQQAALLAQGCLERGTAKCTFGTGAFLLANSGGQAVRSSSGLTSSVAWQVRQGHSYCVDGQVYTAASAVRWLCDLGIIDAVTDLDAVAAESSGSAICVPALAGLAAPWWRPEATGSLTGMTLATGRGEIVRAVVDGIAAQVAELVDAVAQDISYPMTRLRVDGGLTASTALMQATADLTRVPVDVYPHPHATALGTAALGRLSLDHELSISEAIFDWRPTVTYRPRWDAGRAEEFREGWRDALQRNISQTIAGGTKK